MRKVFLSGLYGHQERDIVERRFHQSSEVAAQIARSGAVVFSRISMSHPINGYLDDLNRLEIGTLWAS
jgi:hypothetical protein